MANTISIVIQAKDSASAVLDKTASNMKKTADRMSSVGSSMTKYVTLPLAGVSAVALKMAGDFEQSLNILQSVSSATALDMKALRTQAVALGNDVALPGVSSRDAAGAMTELAKAGLGVKDIMSSSKGVLSLAKAGQLEVADAAMTTARALNAYGLAGDQASKIADVLAAAANASTASVQDMAFGLQMAGAQSHQMGVSLQDTVTALAMFSNAGINGSDAGTSLKQMFLQLATPTEEASNLMKKLGLDFFDAQGNFVGLRSTAQQLNDKLKNLTVEQRTAALATIFGSDATRVAAILAQNGAAGFDKMSKSVNKSGAAMDLAAAQNKGFNGALDNLKSTAETALTDLGTKLLPTVTSALKDASGALSTVADWFNNLSPTSQRVIGDIVLALAVGGPLLIGIAKVIEAIQLIGGAFTAMKAIAIASTVEVGGAVRVMQQIIATPTVMGGIAVAGALADIALVMAAVDAVRGAIREMDAAAKSAKGAQDAMQQRINTDNNLIKNGTPEQRMRAAQDLVKLGLPQNYVPTYSTGGFTGAGGVNEVAGIVHKGEYVLPQSMVDQRTGTPKIGGSGVVIQNLNVHNNVDVNRVVRQIGWRLAAA